MNLKFFSLYLLLALLILSGCSALTNINGMILLGRYSREKDDQHRLVKAVNARYDVLTKTIAQGHISEYKDKSSFVTSFGEPILKKDMGNGTERWLYRYDIYKMAKDKVYVYFDHDGKMIRWEQLPCQKLF